MLDVVGGLGFRFLVAGVRLGVFEALAERPSSAADLARTLEVDEAALRNLLAALESLGYLKLDGGAYHATPMTRKWLLKASPVSFEPGVRFWGRVLAELFGDVEQTVRTGRTPVDFYDWVEERPEVSEEFQQWMAALARLGADAVVKKARLPDRPRRLLDVGGGHGYYSIAFCRAHPGLTAEVLDSTEALRSARRLLAKENAGGVVSLREGDFMEDDLGEGFDAALVFNVAHGLSPEDNRRLLGRVRDALRPGGTVLLLEQVDGKAPGPAGEAAARVIGMGLFHLLGGRDHSEADLTGWLRDAGFVDVRGAAFANLPGMRLVAARVPE